MSKNAQEIGIINAPKKQVEEKIPGMPGLYLATYPSGRRTYIQRYRDPATGKKTSRTLGVVKK